MENTPCVSLRIHTHYFFHELRATILVVAMVTVSLVRIQVKQIMEEAVTRKFVHEESSSITSLCGKYLQQLKRWQSGA